MGKRSPERVPFGWSSGLIAVALAVGAACSAEPGDSTTAGRHIGADPGAAANGPLPVDPGASPLRRLTNDEYDATVADLMGDTSAPARTFPGATTSMQGYDNYASGLGVSATHAEAFLTAAESLATKAVADLPKLLACDVAAKGEEPCMAQWVESFGLRAFRRPLTQAEQTRFVDLAKTIRKTQPLADAIRVTLEAFLVSPAFLYRIEVGTPGKPGEFATVSSWEMASRLSYLFTGSMPDDELFRAARADELLVPANVEKQARRLIATPRAKDVFRRFTDQWLELRAITTMQKSEALEGWDDGLKPLMKEEANRLVDSVLWEGNGDARRLLSADYTFVNGPLAAFYGMKGVSGDAFVRVPVEATQRRGLLTMPGVLASHGKPNETLPTRRGKFIRTKLFCTPVGDPPPNAVADAPQRAPGSTVREFFTAIEKQPACGSCHTALDGMGFGLESYDSLGRFRTMDLGKPVDAAGTLVGTDVDGPFNGGVELAKRLEGSKAVAACIARQAFRFAAGRADTASDAHSLETLTTAFTAASFDMRELYVALAKTDAFLLKPALGAAP